MDDGSTVAALAGLVGAHREQAWSRLVAEHGPGVFRLIASRSRDAHEAEDAYQEFWLRLPEAAASFAPGTDDPERAARSWLMRVAYTTAIDHLRRRRAATRRTVHADIEAEAPMDSDDDGRSALVERIRQAMEVLPEAHRRPLVLHLVAGLSYEELAADLRCTVNNARVKVHRALQQLRQAVGAGADALPESAIAGMLVPPFVLPLVPPALPPPMVPPPVVPPPLGPLALLAKAPIALAAGAVAVTATVAGVSFAVVSTRSEEAPMPVARPFAATALAVGAIAAADIIDDFERDDSAMVGSGPDNRKGVLAIVAAPAGMGQGRALRLAWPEPHGIWVDSGYLKPRPVPALAAPGAAVATAAVWAEAFAGIRYLAIRCIDAQGESFEWRADLPNPGQSGWRSVTFRIDPEKTAGHWGGKEPNGRPDFPLSLQGYAVCLDDAKVPAGAVVIDNVAIAAPAAR